MAPYHPDYQAEEDVYSSSASEDQFPRVRRGSEGYEVRPVDREGMLQQHLLALGEEPDKYIRYIPEPDTDSGSEEDVPVSQHSNNMPNNTDIELY